MADIEVDFINLARLTVEGKKADSAALMRKTLRAILKKRPELSEQADGVLGQIQRSSNMRFSNGEIDPLPVDIDSRLELVKKESFSFIDADPVWTDEIRRTMELVLEERKRQEELEKAGLVPTKTILFSGPPGTGKTLSAHWLAMKLKKPLLTLDLAAVMSSYLGKTGNNIRSVLEYAQKTPSILLLDEFDAIAKKRDDSNEVGELKRLVTVILQAVDKWPHEGLLLAATNHPELLDPAVWRRFDRIVEFHKPSPSEQESYIHQKLDTIDHGLKQYVTLLALTFGNLSYAEIEKRLNALLREAIIEGTSISDRFDSYLSDKMKSFDVEKRLSFAKVLERHGYSQRRIQDFTGCSRDTLREHGIGTQKSKTQKVKS